MKPQSRHRHSPGRRRRTVQAITFLAAGALAVAGTLAWLARPTPHLAPVIAYAHANEDTISQGLSRDGWDAIEPYLTPAAVSGKDFGQIFDTPVNGQVYGQPLVVGRSVLVATENDYVYSISRDTGAVNWSTQLGTPWAAQAVENCKSRIPIEPYVGVTSAPVYDPGTRTLYVTGMVSGAPGDDSAVTTATPEYDLFALNAATGAVKWRQQIAGSPVNNPGIRFKASLQLQRTGLLLLHGAVYMGFGALCADLAPAHGYDGFIAGVSTTPKAGSTTHAQVLWSDQSGGGGSYGGIWQGGGGLVSDGTSIYFSTGNGSAPPPSTPGSATSAVAHFGQSLVKLSVDSSGQGTWSLRPSGFFSPGNADTMASHDHDFGSGGPVLLPFTTSSYPGGLLFTADKEAYSYLISAASPGGRSGSATGSTAVWTGQPSFLDNPPSASASIPSVGHGLWGHVAAIAGTVTSGAATTHADYIYYEGTGWDGYAQMYALKFDGSRPAAPTLANVASTSLAAPAGFPAGDASAPGAGFGFSSGSPVVTSSGPAMSSAVVWEVYAPNSSGMVAATAGTPQVPGRLMAFAALPTSSGGLTQLFSAPIGDAAEFTVPATSDGRVYVAARNDGGAATATGTCATGFESATYTSTDSACVGQVHEFGLTGSAPGAATTAARVRPDGSGDGPREQRLQPQRGVVALDGVEPPLVGEQRQQRAVKAPGQHLAAADAP